MDGGAVKWLQARIWSRRSRDVPPDGLVEAIALAGPADTEAAVESSYDAGGQAGTRALRVATWNMDHWTRTVSQRERAWSKLGELGVDVALLQEMVSPASVPRDHVVYRPNGYSRGWGSAVVALERDIGIQELDVVGRRYGRQLFPMLGSLPGAVMVARAIVPEFGSLTFVSVYGAIETYSQTTMFRVVADLIPLFDAPEGEHVVLGG